MDGRFDACPRHEYSVIRIKDDEAEKVAMAGSPTALKSIGRTIIIRTSAMNRRHSIIYIYICVRVCICMAAAILIRRIFFLAS